MDRGIDDVLHKPVGVDGGTGFPEEIDPVVDLQAGDGEGRAGGAVMMREDGFLLVVEGAGFLGEGDVVRIGSAVPTT